MAAGKEIRGKIKSVENTKKITKAMEMVAASKMRKAQERMRAARPYAERVRSLAANLSHATPEYKHPFLVANADAKAAGFIVVTTDKGLCGGLNTNILRATTAKLRELEGQGAEGRGGRDRQQGPGLPEPDRRQGRLARDPARRPAAARKADRPGQGAARRLRRRPALRRLPLLHALHQHDAPGAGDPAAAAALRRADAEGRRQARLGLHLRAGSARSSSTSCWCATSRRWSTRRRPRTWPPSSRRGWSR